MANLDNFCRGEFQKSVTIDKLPTCWLTHQKEHSYIWLLIEINRLFPFVSGYGHVAPITPLGRLVTIVYAVIGIPLTLLCLTNMGDLMAKGFRFLYARICCGICCRPFRWRPKPRPDPEKGEIHVVSHKKEDIEEEIRVPTLLCVFMIVGYIFAGAFLFSLWENWDYVTGSYFCFITLSTIGFGDIVPGMDIQSWSKQEKLALCTLYLVVGLAMLAMCFTLVQEDVKAKCRWLGQKIGILERNEK